MEKLMRIFLLAALCAAALTAVFPAVEEDNAFAATEEDAAFLTAQDAAFSTAQARTSPIVPVAEEEAALPAAEEESNLYFIAVQDSVLPLSEEAMPFWNGDDLYVSTSVFADKTVERKLNLSRIQDSAKGFVILNRGWDTLEFEAGKTYAIDMEGNIYTPGLIQRDGGYYVPVALAARYFDLRCSVLDVDYGFLIWLREQDFPIKQAAFLGAAAFQIRAVYEEYRGIPASPVEEEAPPSVTPLPVSSPSALTPERPSTPTPVSVNTEPPAAMQEEPPAAPQEPDAAARESDAAARETGGGARETDSARPDSTRREADGAVQRPDGAPSEGNTGPIAGGQNLYLCLRGDRGTAALLDILERGGARAAFFCDLEFLEEQSGLLRRIAADGHGIGLIADGDSVDAIANATAARSVAEQLEEGNFLLERAACQKTRLALLENCAAADYQAAREYGFVCLLPDGVPLDTRESSGGASADARENSGSASADARKNSGDVLSGALENSGDNFPAESKNVLTAGALDSAEQAAELVQRVILEGGSPVLWLGESPSPEGLEAFLSAAVAAGGVCRSPWETAFFS